METERELETEPKVGTRMEPERQLETFVDFFKFQMPVRYFNSAHIMPEVPALL
jgi:hypothetical protein